MNLLLELPKNTTKINSVWDLVNINPSFPDKHKPKYGGRLYIKSALEDHYEEYNFDDSVSSDKINKYIESGQLYFMEPSKLEIMEIEKLELKHLSLYGKNLGLLDNTNTFMTLEGLDYALNQVIAERIGWNLKDIKPIFYPLSDLTEEIEINGEKFIPLRILFNEFGGGFKDLDSFESNRLPDYRWTPLISLNYTQLSKLFEWHFDVFQLILKGLAVDINTLKL